MFTVPLVDDGKTRSEEITTLAVHICNEIETHDKEGKSTLVKTALWLQTIHYFLNVVAFSVCLLLRPGDYIFVPDYVIWLYVVFGLVSSLSLVAWLAVLVQNKEAASKEE